MLMESDSREMDDLSNSFRRNNLQYNKYDNRNTKYDRQPKYPRKDNNYNNKSNSNREYKKNRGNQNTLKSASTGSSGRWGPEANRDADFNHINSNASHLSSKSLEQHDLSMKNKSVERSTTYASSTGSNSSGSNYSSNKENQQNSSSSHANHSSKPVVVESQPRNPFRFELTEEDDDLCQTTNDRVYNLYQSVMVDEELLRMLQSTYMNVHQYLMLQQKNFCDFLEEKRNHEINTWLASKSETEQKRYFERNPSQQPVSQRS